MVRQALYWPPVMLRESSRPTRRALPMLVRSRKEIR